MALTEVTDTNFVGAVLENDQPVIVDFWAPWCGPCRMVAPALEAIAQEHPEWKIVKLNVDDNPQTAASFGIQSIPTMLVFDKGTNVGRIQGAQSKDTIKRQITQSVS